jgi:signal transduction histidine kinase
MASSFFSLRARLLLGAVLWTIGLFTATGVAFTHVMLLNPSAPGFFHHLFMHFTASTIVAVVCMVAGLVQVRRGLSAVSQVRERLADVHAGRERRMHGDYPAEVQPLVSDLNRLLEARDESIARAQAKAGDLAHGLKTPLAVLAQEADRASVAGLGEVAVAIREEVERMRRQIEYHLAHARAAASGATPGARANVAETVGGLKRTLDRLYLDHGLTISAEIDPAHTIQGQREDLEEMLGNLLDNACKWAQKRVVVRSALETHVLVITVDDDGPGLEPAMREAVLKRGVRADEAAPGSGLGLAIVGELAGLYGGTIALSASPEGGLRATLRLPSGERTI